MSEQPLDLSSCDKEPIHIPGFIQPHGFLLCVDNDGLVVQASENCEAHLGRPLDTLLGTSVGDLFESPLGDFVEVAGKRYEISSHLSGDVTILEFEPADHGNHDVDYGFVHAAVDAIRKTKSVRDCAAEIVDRVRSICGLDRVMVYKFLEDGVGTVIAESKRDDVEAYLGLHYPASDIPQQARQLYLRNWTRLISDVSYEPCPIVPTLNPVTEMPLDMSDCALRSVSPIHVQYLRNMGVAASMSISIEIDGKLWGLIACHHMTPWYTSKRLRQACEILGQVASLQISSLQNAEFHDSLVKRRHLLHQIINNLEEEATGIDILARDPDDLMSLVGATGAAIVTSNGCYLSGATPSTTEVERLAQWIGNRPWHEPLAINSLSQTFPESERYASLASGVLALSLSRSSSNCILWFRPEIVETVIWAGDPRRAKDPENLSPRTSFEAWRSQERYRSRSWSAADLAIASELRIAMLEFEVNTLNSQLERKVEERTMQLQKAVDELNGFTYSVSHDLRTPLRAMVGNSRIVLEEYGDQISKQGRSHLRSIESNALKMATLVDDLLSFARLGRQEVRRQDINVSNIAERAASKLRALGWPCENMEIEIQPGMTANGDGALLEILFTILIENGCKYVSSGQCPSITIGEKDGVFFVRNVGIGFENQYAKRIFRPFERLHRDGEYPGTGIGLANGLRIVERHSGEMWAEGTVGEGASFFFTIGRPRFA